MRKILILLLFLAAFALALQAQTVLENESSILFGEKSANVTLVVVNDGKAFDGKIALEFIDPSDKIRGRTELQVTFEPGRTTHLIAVPFDELSQSDRDNLAWFRLRYRVGATTGVVGISTISRDVFDLEVISSRWIFGGMTHRGRVFASNPTTKEPVAGVRIEAKLDLEVGGESEKIEIVSNAETGQDGYAEIEFKIPPGKDLDDGELTVRGNRNGVVRVARKDVDANGDQFRFLALFDKPIYQPGQTMHFRGLLLRSFVDDIVVPATEIELEIEDNDNTTVLRQILKTSDFGVAATEWQIPDNLKPGDYEFRVSARKGGDFDSVYYRNLTISRYEIPNFAVAARSVKPFYLPSDSTAEIEISADYLFGKPVANGSVRVIRNNGGEWNWKTQTYEVEEGACREGLADENGKLKVSFDLKEEFSDLDEWRKYRDLKFTAYVTDPTTNRREQRTFNVRISREPIHVYLIGRTDNLNPNISATTYISTFYPDGTAAVCDVEIGVRPSENSSSLWKKIRNLRSNTFGAAKFAFRRSDFGNDGKEFEIVVTAKDKSGQIGTYGGENDRTEIDFDDDDPGMIVRTPRTILRPGEPISLEIESSTKSGVVYVDVLDQFSNLKNLRSTLSNGRARLTIPYDSRFKADLMIAAFSEDDQGEMFAGTVGVVYPSPANLRLNAVFDHESYKPGEKASIAFGVLDTNGKAIEAALGLAIVDSAVEQRALTDFSYLGAFHDYEGALYLGRSFGDVSLKQILELDTTKSISGELDLVAEVMLSNGGYWPENFKSSEESYEAAMLFKKHFEDQFVPIEKALRDRYEKFDFDHPTDDVSLSRILQNASLDLETPRDPWGMRYRPKFAVEKTNDNLKISSAGPDKVFDTRDDIEILGMKFEYFPPTGRLIDEAHAKYHMRTGKYVSDVRTLFAELGISELKDRFGRSYQISFLVDGRNFKTQFRSLGPNVADWRDDFDVWTTTVDYFAETEKKIAGVFTEAKTLPGSEAEINKFLVDAGINLESLRDGYGERLTISRGGIWQYADKTETVVENIDGILREKKIVKPVVRLSVGFVVIGHGADRMPGTSDDVRFAEFSRIVSERSKDDIPNETNAFKAESFGFGSIIGVVTDANGAVIPNSSVTAKNEKSGVEFKLTANGDGQFFFYLESGTYSVIAKASGFKDMENPGIVVEFGRLREITIALEPGTGSVTVDVSSGPDPTQTSKSESSPAEKSKTRRPSRQESQTSNQDRDRGNAISTPRLRNYFPETLFWAPEIITDKNGKASVNFKMADNITTWKMFAVASTKDGKIGVVEKEVTAFQPFFVDLDPPKFLTDGDEIFLPTQVRNYTATKQKVGVTMSRADWFSLLGPESQNIEVESNQAANAVFGFRANSAIKDGKQRVTAIAEKESDAIEKAVTVRPNGHEVVRTESKLFSNKETFALDFPANALAKTPRAELKIYPNLMSHVTESVEGLLQRPYGCGEQTISSTYPNLMILKFGAGGETLAKKARKFLEKGHEKLLGYQVADGGFSYWGGKDSSDLTLTAYALRFLSDAKGFVETDPKVTDNALAYLAKQQRADGSFTKVYSWEKAEDPKRTKLLTTYVVRTLGMIKAKSGKPVSPGFDAALAKAMAYLKSRTEEIDEPYSIALYGLAALDAGDREAADKSAARLAKLAITEGQAVYWNLETNTPFYGWGTAGRIETTALALQLLVKTNEQRTTNNELISKATMFLLKNKDRYGVWYSTQTTINVLDAFLASLKPAREQKISVRAGGKVLKEIAVSAEQIEPISVELNSQTSPSVEIAGAADSNLMAQVVRTHYVDWKDAEITRRDVNQSRAVELDYRCDKPSPKIMETVTCSVKAERVGFKGYGMLLAEIGIPPGADVSRESLEKALENDWSLSRYEVLPDRIVVYLWAKAGGTNFNFSFKPRYGINALTPASVLYDYYNEDAKATVAPMKFEVK